MPLAAQYRPRHAGEPLPTGAVRVRHAVEQWTDFGKPRVGYRCDNESCQAAVVLIEADLTKASVREPCLMTAARCPFCQQKLTQVSYYEVAELVPVGT
jgi:hypothetical protein